MNHQQIPNNDAVLQTSFCSYQPSVQTLTLNSEKNRTVLAEKFETNSAASLSSLCLKVLAENYKIQPFSMTGFETIQLRTFYDCVDVDLPIEKCISIEDDYFWKRVYSSKCADDMLLKQKSKQEDISWKSLSIALKFIDLIENTPYESWISEEMEEITKIVSPYVTKLNISKLQAMPDRSFDKLSEISSKSSKASTSTIRVEENKDSDLKSIETSESKYDFPFDDCHHVDLSILGGLLNLSSLTVEFIPQKLNSNYESRFFNFSYLDMQNLARGTSKLQNLRIFKLRRSRVNSDKFSIILDALQSIYVEELEFYFCQLDDNCGESLYEYIVSTKSLKHLDLSGNYFKEQAINYLSRAIQISHSKLNYLGLCNNPFSGDSLCNLTKALETYEHLKVLKLSGIQNVDTVSSGITMLVKNNSHLFELHVIGVPLSGFGLIEALKNNHQIQQIFCQGCGLTLEEEFKVEILLKRNRYIQSNPYIGDITKNEEEINAFITKTKNPIFIKTLKDKKERSKCFQHKVMEETKSLFV